MVTVDVKGSWQRWLKVRDLIKGATYMFGVQALTVSYGPPIQANITAQPVTGRQGRQNHLLKGQMQMQKVNKYIEIKIGCCSK